MNLSAKPLHVQLKNAGTSRACKIKSKVAPIQVQERTKSTQLQSCFSSSSSSCNRRKALGVVVAAHLLTTVRPKPAAAIAEKPVEVSNYLPSSSGKEGFYEFIPGDRETPAIRAGTIGKYKFDLPGKFLEKEVRRKEKNFSPIPFSSLVFSCFKTDFASFALSNFCRNVGQTDCSQHLEWQLLPASL